MDNKLEVIWLYPKSFPGVKSRVLELLGLLCTKPYAVKEILDPNGGHEQFITILEETLDVVQLVYDELTECHVCSRDVVWKENPVVVKWRDASGDGYICGDRVHTLSTANAIVSRINPLLAKYGLVYLGENTKKNPATRIKQMVEYALEGSAEPCAVVHLPISPRRLCRIKSDGVPDLPNGVYGSWQELLELLGVVPLPPSKVTKLVEIDLEGDELNSIKNTAKVITRYGTVDRIHHTAFKLFLQAGIDLDGVLDKYKGVK